MTFESLIAALAEKAGIPGEFSADGDGVARVRIDDFELAFMEVPETGQMLVWCCLGGAMAEDLAHSTEELLGGNFARRGGGAALSLGEDGLAYAHRYVATEGLDADDFVEGALEEFLGVLADPAGRGGGAADDAADGSGEGNPGMGEDCLDLLFAFAETAGLGDVPLPGGDGVWRLTNGIVSFGFRELAASRELLVEAELCAVPEKGREKFLSALAKANFMGQGAAGGVLAVSGDGRVMLFRRFPLEGLTDESLAEAFEELAAAAFEWRRTADAYVPVAEREAQTETDARDFEMQAFRGEFLRV